MIAVPGAGDKQRNKIEVARTFLGNIGVDDTLLNLDSEAEIDDAILTLVERVAQ